MAALASPAASETVATAPLTSAPGATRVRVLACADSFALKGGISALDAAGFAVYPANGWTEGFELFHELAAPVVLIEDTFRGSNGFGMCEALRRLPGGAAVPIVIVCGSEYSVRRAFEAGATDVIDKPVDFYVLARRLARLEESYRKGQELDRAQAQAAEAERTAARACLRLERQETVDALTGLPNRARLDALVERTLAAGSGPRTSVALLVLDLDRFSEINDSLGRANGDEVLKQVAGRLADCLRGSEMLEGPASGFLRAAARLAGDEFALMLTGVLDEEALSRFARRVLEALSAAIPVAGTDVFLSASVGISCSSAAAGASKLLQDAETALYEAKKRGGSTYSIYRESLTGAAQNKLGMDRRLRAAFERGELRLHYQPIVDAATQTVRGAEALLRWTDPSRGPVSPLEFVPIAEDTGLMTRIGPWVIRQACGQLRSWIDDGLPPFRMAVNVSRCQLRQGDLPAVVRAAIDEAGIDPGLLELEISERGALRDDPAVLAQFRALNAMGVRIVVDDFGTGHTGIVYLRQFPLDGLKIDRSFVIGLGEDLDDSAITSAIIAMAHRLKLDVVAEGVEQASQLAALREYGCGVIQGHLFAKAMPADDFRRAVRTLDDMAYLAGEAGAPPPGH